MAPQAAPADDRVPPIPGHGHPNPLSSLDEMRGNISDLSGRVARLEQLAQRHVSASGARKLTTKEKIVAGATAAGFVAVGVVTTLAVQRVRRGKTNRMPGEVPQPMVGITT